MRLSCSIKIRHIKGGIAAFNAFNGNTHLLSPPYSWVIEQLNIKPRSNESLFHEYIQFQSSFQKNDTTTDKIATQFHLFITEAKKSGILIEDK